MNKININAVLIVEGKADVSYLSSFIDTYFFTTNGYDINEEKLEFLRSASKVRKLIIYTDPDEAGDRIRNIIKTNINGVFDAKSERITKKFTKKSGVAELVKDEVIRTLTPFATNEEITHIDYDLPRLISLSDNPSEAKAKIINKYRLIKGNNKFLENQLNILNITKKELEDLISGN